MQMKTDKKAWKAEYFLRLANLLDEYNKFFLVNVDNISSKQMQSIRKVLRGKAELLMGKNTMMRKAIRGHLDKIPALEKVLNCLKGNVGFVFTKEDVVEIRDLIKEQNVKAPARAGAIAPNDVSIPAQNTGLGPEKTSFFQALSIQTKISKGTIEITNNVPLIKEGDKVGASEATLLNMMKIMPFYYGLNIEKIYDDGAIFSPEILDITDEDLQKTFMQGVSVIASVSLAIGYPTVCSVPHSIINGYKNVLALAVETDISFPLADKVKEYLADPSAFAAAAPAAASSAPAASEAAPAKEESEEESDDDMGFGLFD
jgi:large subunit ribosomal protein LP0